MKTQVHFAQRASSVLYFYLKSLPNDKSEWLLPANVCPIVAATFLKAGKKITFLDINLETLSFDVDQLRKTISARINEIQGVIWVRAYGYTVDHLDDVFRGLLVQSPSLKIIDDACLMQPEFNKIPKVADLILFSTGYSKFVDVGFGGWGVSKESLHFTKYESSFDEKAYQDIVNQFADCLKNKTVFVAPKGAWLDLREPQYDTTNYLEDIYAKSLEARTHKEKLNAVYEEHLSRWAYPKTHHDWRFNLLSKNRDQLLAKIFAAGHFASKNYPSLVSLFSAGSDSKAKQFESQIINLFNDFRYSEERALELARLVKQAMENE